MGESTGAVFEEEGGKKTGKRTHGMMYGICHIRMLCYYDVIDRI